MNKMSMKQTILMNKKEDEPIYFHVWRHCGTKEYFMEIGNQTIRLSLEEVKTLVYGAKHGFNINENYYGGK